MNVDYQWMMIETAAKKLLVDTNWTQFLDSGLSLAKRLEYEAYRDALDSLRDTFTSPDDVVFPVPPTE